MRNNMNMVNFIDAEHHVDLDEDERRVLARRDASAILQVKFCKHFMPITNENT